MQKKYDVNKCRDKWFHQNHFGLYLGNGFRLSSLVHHCILFQHYLLGLIKKLNAKSLKTFDLYRF